MHIHTVQPLFLRIHEIMQDFYHRQYLKGIIHLGARGSKPDTGRSSNEQNLSQEKCQPRGMEQPTSSCNSTLLRPLIKRLFLLVPSGFIIIKIKKNS